LKSFSHRPALVIQSDLIDTGLAQWIVALITSNLQRAGPTRVFVAKDSSAGKQMGILLDSMVVLDNLATINASALHRSIGRLGDMDEVDTAIRLTLGLS